MTISLTRWKAAPALVGCAVLTLAACATVPPPKEQLAVAEAAVEEARRAGGTEAAPVEMSQAQEKLTAARAAVRSEDNARARRLAEQAEVDAQRAAAKARAARADRALTELRESERVLSEELNRQTVVPPAIKDPAR
jgi:hypothetical protein